MHIPFDDDRPSPLAGTSAYPDGQRGKLALPWSLLLLGAGYFLLVAGPLLTARFSSLSVLRGSSSGQVWLPTPVTLGAALLGAAALIFVIARLVRDVEQRPYASIAPVLAVFSGFVLASLRAELPLPGVGATPLGFAVLALALLGGVLIGHEDLGERSLGWVLAALPTVAVLSATTAVLGHANPLVMLTVSEPSVRLYLLLLGVSSLCLGFVGKVSRNLTQRADLLARAELNASYARGDARFDPSLAAAVSMPAPSLRIPNTRLHSAAQANPSLRVTQSQHGLQSASRSQTHQVQTRAAAPAAQRGAPQAVARTQPMNRPGYGHVATSPAAPQRGLHLNVPMASELAGDDPDLLLLTRPRLPFSRILTVLLALTVALAGGIYYFVVLPRQQGVAPPVVKPPAPVQAAPRVSDAPVVTPLLEDPAPTPVTPSKPAEAVEHALPAIPSEVPVDRAHRSHSHHHRRHAEDGAKGPEQVREPSVPEASSERGTPKAPAAAAKPAAAPAAPAKKTSSEDLDLDDSVQKALKGSGGKSSGVSAGDDPILGL